MRLVKRLAYSITTLLHAAGLQATRLIQFCLMIGLVASGCSNDKNKAIELVQKAKLEGTLMTNLDYANATAANESGSKYEWAAEETPQRNVFLVSFCDEKGWGVRWEANLDQSIVKHVNGNEFLSRKYGLSRLDQSNIFSI